LVLAELKTLLETGAALGGDPIVRGVPRDTWRTEWRVTVAE
jgi:hypothetical protein